MSRRIFAFSFVALILSALGACERSDTARKRLPPVPQPDLSTVEAPIREQLQAFRDQLQRWREDPEIGAEQLAGAYGDLGTLYWTYGLDEAARVALENARALDSDHRWHYYLGFVYYDLGLTAEALRELERALERKPGDIPTVAALAQVYLERGEVDLAADSAHRIIQIDPEAAAGYYLAGSAALQGGRFNEAIDRLERTLELQPEASAVHFLLAQAYRGLGDADRAMEHGALAGERTIALEDALVGPLAYLEVGSQRRLREASTELRENDLEGAEHHLRKALEAAPESLIVRLNLGSVLSRQGRQEEARAVLNEILEREPENAYAFLALGLTHAREGDEARAIDCYRRALASEPNLRNGNLNLANALRRRDDCEQAIPYYEKAVWQAPDDSRPALGKAECEARLGDYAAARSTLEGGLEHSSESPMLRNALARLLAVAPDEGLRNGERAIELVRPVVESAPIVDYVTTLAMAYAATGEYEQAVQWQRAALASAVKAGETELATELETDLNRYRSDLPARNPWTE